MLCYLAIAQLSHDMELQTEGTSVHRGSSLSEDIYLFLAQVVIEDFLCASHSRRHRKSLGGRWGDRVGNAKGSTSYGAEFFPIGYLVYTVPQLCLSVANLT